MLCHRLHQSTTLRILLLTDDLLQLQHLGSCGIEQRERGTDLLYRILETEWTEAEGHHYSLGLA
jgi:hypothetical protein